MFLAVKLLNIVLVSAQFVALVALGIRVAVQRRAGHLWWIAPLLLVFGSSLNACDAIYVAHVQPGMTLANSYTPASATLGQASYLIALMLLIVVMARIVARPSSPASTPDPALAGVDADTWPPAPRTDG